MEATRYRREKWREKYLKKYVDDDNWSRRLRRQWRRKQIQPLLYKDNAKKNSESNITRFGYFRSTNIIIQQPNRQKDELNGNYFPGTRNN